MKQKIFTSIVIIVIIVMAVFFYNLNFNQPKVNDTDSTQEGIQKVVDANNEFAFDIYHELSKNNSENVLYSPYSISSALAMVYEGARGNTSKEIKSVFHFPERNVLRPNFAAIYNSINENHKYYDFRTADTMWLQIKFPLLENYTKTIKEYYGGEARNLNFVDKPEESREIINKFIEKKTNGKIEDLLPPGSINSYTRLVITNAVYFKGDWKWEFDKSKTNEDNFYISSEEVVRAPMMTMKPKDELDFNYTEEKSFQMLELPYKGDEISMLILLPKRGIFFDRNSRKYKNYSYTIEDIENNLTVDNFNNWKGHMRETHLSTISIPKFEFKRKYKLSNELGDLGMPNAFSSRADFSGMDGRKDLCIDQVYHQAYIKVDEKGTEATAATAVSMKLLAQREGHFSFVANHPFIFIIQQKKNGNILFVGKVVDPTEKL